MNQNNRINSNRILLEATTKKLINSFKFQSQGED